MDIILRKEAKLLGLTRYFTGKSCKHGHVAQRVTSSGTCETCAQNRYSSDGKRWRENNKEAQSLMYKRYRAKNLEAIHQQAKHYYINNSEIIKKKSRDFYHENPEKCVGWAKQYYINNKQRVLDYSVQWRKDNPDKVAEYAKRRDGRVRDNKPIWFEELLVRELYRNRDILNKLWGTNFHVDHVIPLHGKNVCGLHCWDNLQLLEHSINNKKRTRFTSDW